MSSSSKTIRTALTRILPVPALFGVVLAATVIPTGGIGAALPIFAGILGSGMFATSLLSCFLVDRKKENVRAHNTTAAICAAVGLGLGAGGTGVLHAQQTVRDVFEQTANAAIADAATANLTTQSPAPATLTAAR